MKTTRTIAAAAAGALGAGALGAGLFALPVSAQAADLGPWTVAPGESFEVTGGDPCLPDPEVDPEPEEMTVTVSIDEAVTPGVTVPVGEDGSWSASVTVSEDEAPGTYSVGARCLSDGTPVSDVGNGDLTVTEGGSGTTETTEPTTETTSGSEPPTPTEPGDGPDDGPDEGPGDEGPSDGGDDGDDGEDAGPQPGEPAPEVNGDADYTG